VTCDWIEAVLGDWQVLKPSIDIKLCVFIAPLQLVKVRMAKAEFLLRPMLDVTFGPTRCKDSEEWDGTVPAMEGL
jgi:hypothetical protein